MILSPPLAHTFFQPSSHLSREHQSLPTKQIFPSPSFCPPLSHTQANRICKLVQSVYGRYTVQNIFPFLSSMCCSLVKNYITNPSVALNFFKTFSVHLDSLCTLVIQRGPSVSPSRHFSLPLSQINMELAH